MALEIPNLQNLGNSPYVTGSVAGPGMDATQWLLLYVDSGATGVTIEDLAEAITAHLLAAPGVTPGPVLKVTETHTEIPSATS